MELFIEVEARFKNAYLVFGVLGDESSFYEKDED